MNQQEYRNLISGRSNGPTAKISRFFLKIAAKVYSILIGLRNSLYSNGWLKIHRVDVPVISVGNITAGGTGKTPLVIWLCNQITQNLKLKAQNYGCAILTRGYKTQKGESSDEPAIIAQSCPEAKVIVNPNRLEGAAEAVNKFSAKALIMDDGFQHRRLGRDVDIVTIDATQPFGYDKMLPAGLLREPTAALKRADAVVVTRCDQTGETELGRLEDKLRLINPDMIIARSIHAPICAKSIGEKEIGLEELKSKKIFAFCGIGNPDAFLSTIRALGCQLAGSNIYNDHYHYTANCLAHIYEQASHLKADLILTTQKDWYCVQYEIHNPQFEIPFAYLAIELKFTAGEDKITQLIKNTLAGKIPSYKNNSQ